MTIGGLHFIGLLSLGIYKFVKRSPGLEAMDTEAGPGLEAMGAEVAPDMDAEVGSETQPLLGTFEDQNDGKDISN